MNATTDNATQDIDEALALIRAEFHKAESANEKLIATAVKQSLAGESRKALATCKELREIGKRADTMVSDAKNLLENLQRWNSGMHNAREKAMLSIINRHSQCYE